jgi:hypothetical protein
MKRKLSTKTSLCPYITLNFVRVKRFGVFATVAKKHPQAKYQESNIDKTTKYLHLKTRFDDVFQQVWKPGIEKDANQNQQNVNSLTHGLNLLSNVC